MTARNGEHRQFFPDLASSQALSRGAGPYTSRPPVAGAVPLPLDPGSRRWYASPPPAPASLPGGQMPGHCVAGETGTVARAPRPTDCLGPRMVTADDQLHARGVRELVDCSKTPANALPPRSAPRCNPRPNGGLPRSTPTAIRTAQEIMFPPCRTFS